MSLPLYESVDGRFYVEFNRHSAQFHVYDRQRYGWRQVASSITTASLAVDRLARQHGEGDAS